MKRKFLLLALASSVLALASGCSDEGPNATGTLAVHLADAPYPFGMIASADLAIDAVEIHVKGAGFHTLAVAESSSVLNLLELQNGVTALLVEAEVPAGSLDQIRLIVREAGVRLTDDRPFDLDIPSGTSSGLKVFVDPEIEVVAGLTTELLLDVDVCSSFRPIPSSATQAAEVDHFRFQPVLRVGNLSVTGTLSGHVRSDAGTDVPSDDVPLQGATVSVWRAGTQVAATGTDATGGWAMAGLEPGECVVRAEAIGHEASEVGATVVVANEVDVSFVLPETP